MLDNVNAANTSGTGKDQRLVLEDLAVRHHGHKAIVIRGLAISTNNDPSITFNGSDSCHDFTLSYRLIAFRYVPLV